MENMTSVNNKNLNKLAYIQYLLIKKKQQQQNISNFLSMNVIFNIQSYIYYISVNLKRCVAISFLII